MTTLIKERVYGPMSEYMPIAGSKGYFANTLKELEEMIDREEPDELVSCNSRVYKEPVEKPFNGRNQEYYTRYFYLISEPNEEDGTLEGKIKEIKHDASVFFMMLEGFIEEALQGDVLENVF